MISIEKLESYHAGNYTCRAKNAVGSTSSSGYLAVLEPPRFQNEPRDSEVILGRRLEVPCAAAGNPRPTIKWMREIDTSRGILFLRILHDCFMKVYFVS